MEIVGPQDSSLAEQARVLRCMGKPVIHSGAIVVSGAGMYRILRHADSLVTITDGDGVYVVDIDTLALYDTGWWQS